MVNYGGRNLIEIPWSEIPDDNQLRSLPSEISRLKRLTYLDLGENHLTSLPSEIGNLINLTKLLCLSIN